MAKCFFFSIDFDNVTLPKRAGAKVKRSKPPPLSFGIEIIARMIAANTVIV